MTTPETETLVDQNGWADVPARRNGFPWNSQEVVDLQAAWATSTVEALATKHERKVGGIIGRAKILGLVPLEEGEELSKSGKGVVKSAAPAKSSGLVAADAGPLEVLVDEKLSEAEAEVALALTRGQTAHQIAEARGRDRTTVAKQIKAACQKLDAADEDDLQVRVREVLAAAKVML